MRPYSFQSQAPCISGHRSPLAIVGSHPGLCYITDIGLPRGSITSLCDVAADTARSEYYPEKEPVTLMLETQDPITTVLSPEVLVTFIVCAMLAGVIIWLVGGWQRRQRRNALAGQRVQQEGAIGRLLDALSQDKEKLVAEHEERLRERDQRIGALEGQVARLRDRITSSGILSLFGGRQRDVVSALLLENEQLHELLATKQLQLRELMADMTTKLMDRIDEQAQESARAVRYKQALLSAFLQHEEARSLLDRMIADGKVAASDAIEPPEAPEQ